MKTRQIKNIFIVSIIAVVLAIVAFIGTILYKDKMEKIRISNMSIEDRTALSYGEVTDADTQTQSENVSFSAFFTRDLDGDGYAERIKGTCKSIGQTDTLYADLRISGEGYLKNGKMTLNGENIDWVTSIVSDNVVDGDYIDKTDEIKLKDRLNGGTQRLFSGIIEYKQKNNINNYSRN